MREQNMNMALSAFIDRLGWTWVQLQIGLPQSKNEKIIKLHHSKLLALDTVNMEAKLHALKFDK